MWTGGGKTVKVVKIPRFPSVSKRPGLDSFDLTYWWGAVLPSLVWVGRVAPDPARIIVRVPGEEEAAWKEREEPQTQPQIQTQIRIKKYMEMKGKNLHKFSGSSWWLCECGESLAHASKYKLKYKNKLNRKYKYKLK